MKINFTDFLTELAQHRPVFHSEADMQHELSWHLRRLNPNLDIRLEYPLLRPGNGAIDVLIRDGAQIAALELKYLCQRFDGEIGGETYALKPQGAQDIRRYDVLKDVWRMEQFIAQRPGAFASVIVLSNDPAYWKGPKSEQTYDAAFSLREGRQISGTLNWSEQTGAGTKRGREKPLQLNGSYQMRWANYSQIDGRFGEFRLLHIDVPNSSPSQTA